MILSAEVPQGAKPEEEACFLLVRMKPHWILQLTKIPFPLPPEPPKDVG